MKQNYHKTAFSLLEMIAVIAILGIVAAVIVPRITGGNETADIAACHVYKGDIEIQAELWIHNTGSWPAANLAAIGADIGYFPEGLPVCPVDGTAYTIDAATGLVVGHTH
jgi:prepilin-type N-terminal cleavage/methylation domain-containing protein